MHGGLESACSTKRKVRYYVLTSSWDELSLNGQNVCWMGHSNIVEDKIRVSCSILWFTKTVKFI